MYILNADYQTMNIKLDSMIPRIPPYVHNFSISNYNDTARTDLNIEYTLSLRTTTNLPLIYELYLNEEHDDTGANNIIISNTSGVDADGTYFRTITTNPKTFGYKNDEINFYQLVIYFPEIYTATQYQDVIEGVEIIVNSRQILN